MNTEYASLDHVVFVHNHRFNILITDRDEESGIQMMVAHYIVPQTFDCNDCYEYAESIIEAMSRGLLPIEHRVVG